MFSYGEETMNRSLISLVTVLALISLTCLNVHAVDSKEPYSKPEGTYISVKGTAVDTGPESFSLDYGKGVVTVKAGGLNWYKKNYKNIEGHHVAVYGKADDDLFEASTIKAISIFDEDLATFFYERSTALNYNYWVVEDLIPGDTIIRGTVTDVFGRRFTLDTGPRMLNVDTGNMAYNPLDEKGLQKIKKGDYVRVRGSMDIDFWKGRRLMADSVIILLEE